jgi:hypothetical protein
LCGAKKPIGVVTPVVGQPALGQAAVVDELVHRHQLDGGDTEPLEVLDGDGVREAE